MEPVNLLSRPVFDRGSEQMNDRFARLVFLGLLVLLGLWVAQPYLQRGFLAATTPRAVDPRGDLVESERLTIDIFNRVSPSVVQVAGRTGGNALMNPEQEGGVQSGTGFIWDEAGDIVTNNHVVEGTSGLVVRLSSDEVGDAEIVGVAPTYDLAVIRLRSPRKVPAPISVGSSADLKVGQMALAIGNPFGLDQSLTTGIISALKRRLPTSGGREIANVIQTDAPINPGNSGGPLLDSAGRLIGVNTAIFSPSGSNAGIGFAIPVDVVNRVVPELIRSGRVPIPGIGIILGSEVAATRLGVQGIIIVRTLPGLPAARAGLRGMNTSAGTLGDVIVAVNDQPVRQVADLLDQIEQVGVGGKVALTVDRGGSQMKMTLDVVDVSQAS
jgi:S1-C subfamily serine protease